MNAIESEFARNWPSAAAEERLVVGVSGGLDSSALLRLCAAASPRRALICVAHFHHQLHTSADEDAEFVRELAQRLGCSFQLGFWSAPASRGDGLEAAARDARYEFLRDAAHEFGARRVAVAHTADDQVETVLHHVLRGASIRGLSGIPPFRKLSEATTLCRPLLGVRRETLKNYLLAIKQAYRVDPTNQSSDFTRNRLRQLLPSISDALGRDPAEAVLRLAEHAREIHAVVARRATSWLDDATIHCSDNFVELRLDDACEIEPVVLREAFVVLWTRLDWPRGDMTAAHWDALASACASSEPVRRSLPGGVEMSRSQETLTCRR